jgi:hypothetical protein
VRKVEPQRSEIESAAISPAHAKPSKILRDYSLAQLIPNRREQR